MTRALLALALASCYRPGEIASCEVSCDSTHACPSGQSCDGTVCHASGVTCGADGGTSDAGPFCFTPALLPMICVPVPLRRSYVGGSFDTSTAQNCDVTVPRGPLSELCVIAADDITISGTTLATGSRSLVLASRHGITISGTLDVSSRDTLEPGAGGTKKCTIGAAGDPEGNAGASGAGGGAGGTFGTMGAKGGSNGGSALGGGPSQVGVLVFDAGQNGGVGGNAYVSDTGGGPCGIGGGAVYLYAQEQATVSGHVLAFGMGGQGAFDFRAGGGGGGAGGMIAIDAPALTLSQTTILGATGGGGGAGANGTQGGDSGMSPTFASGSVPAMGGATPVSGGNGATGAMARGAMEATPGANGSQTGGGGGGGGAGVIRMPVAVAPTGSIIYPPPS